MLQNARKLQPVKPNESNCKFRGCKLYSQVVLSYVVPKIESYDFQTRFPKIDDIYEIQNWNVRYVNVFNNYMILTTEGLGHPQFGVKQKIFKSKEMF